MVRIISAATAPANDCFGAVNLGRRIPGLGQEPLDLPPGSRHPTSVATTLPLDGQAPNDRRTTLAVQQAALDGKARGQTAVRHPQLHVHALKAGVD